MFKRHVLLAAISVLTLTAVSFAATIDVPADQPTIQAGINAAIDGDTVLIADGTYTGDGNREVVVTGKQIVIKGANGPDAVIVFCADTVAQQRYRGLSFLGAAASGSIIEGITITDAFADTGSAVYAEDASLSFNNCKFANSGLSDDYSYTPYAGGGGFFRRCPEVSFDACSFEKCEGDGGGGFFADSCGIVTVAECEFIENYSDGVMGFDAKTGGCAMLRACDSVYFHDCLFQGNWGDGASYVSHFGTPGVASLGSNLWIHSSLFDHNHSYAWDNSGTSVWAMNGSLELAGCTFYNNESYGFAYSGVVYVRTDDALIRNCIFAFNDVPDPVIGYYDCLPPVLECSNVYGNTVGKWHPDMTDYFIQTDNISNDPLFCDAENGDFTVGDASYCLPANNECGELMGAFGQGCTGCFDVDNDGHCFAEDNCPDWPNSGQADADGMGLGDACCACECPTLGNIDGSDDCLVTMSDLTAIISHLFILIEPYDCPAAANVDESIDGFVTMGDLTILIDHLFISLDPLPPCTMR